MSTARTPDGAPQGLVQMGLTTSSHQLTVGQPEPLVKPASEAAHQPGQQPAATILRARVCHPSGTPRRRRQDAVTTARHTHADTTLYDPGHCPLCAWYRETVCGPGSAVECSTERSRAPDRQPVAPVEGRAWETPQTGTV